jgi:sugar/nucleoside kinase (ribokinase family)
MKEEIGGAAFNAARAAAQRGVKVAFLSVRGGDRAGEEVARAIAAAGLEDLSACFLDRPTPSYTALLDEGGQVVAALADMALYERGFPRVIVRRSLRDAVCGAAAILCDANLPEAALERLAAAANDRPLYAIAVSPAKARRLTSIAARIAGLFMTRAEAASLTGLAAGAKPAALIEALRKLGFMGAVVSDGAGPLHLADGDRIWGLMPPLVETIADVTGAGDALAGATVAALMAGQLFPAAVREGVAAATIVVQDSRAAPHLEAGRFAAALARVPEPELLSATGDIA